MVNRPRSSERLLSAIIRLVLLVEEMDVVNITQRPASYYSTRDKESTDNNSRYLTEVNLSSSPFQTCAKGWNLSPSAPNTNDGIPPL
jgi:hypothetical protein